MNFSSGVNHHKIIQKALDTVPLIVETIQGRDAGAAAVRPLPGPHRPGPGQGRAGRQAKDDGEDKGRRDEDTRRGKGGRGGQLVRQRV